MLFSYFFIFSWLSMHFFRKSVFFDLKFLHLHNFPKLLSKYTFWLY
jgi:hypothetical protein